MKKNRFGRNWWLFISLALVAGTVLRVLYVNDMEYKEDEEYNFTQTQLIGNTQPWPWYGIPSGVYLVNPGMSIWVFTVLAKLFGIHQPTSLAHAVQLFALLGISLVIPFAIMFLNKEEVKTWLWAFALAMVNPFLILYQRKLWPEPFLPFFTMLTLMGWWTRKNFWGALLWGFIGAWLGQIHMSGFFFAAALFLWTAFFDRKSANWKGWFLGSVSGALPLIPWVLYAVSHPIGGRMSAGWSEITQLKYWTFWFTDPTGLHLGNPLGLLRGESNWAQISDFVRYPLWEGHATYLNGLAHLVALGATLLLFSRGLFGIWANWKKDGVSLCSMFIGKHSRRDSQTSFVQNSALWGCGILLTVTGVVIRRYYMAVTFPLEFICLIRMARPDTKTGNKILVSLWLAELFMSATFVGYIHVNEGSVAGDYGKAYHLLKK